MGSLSRDELRRLYRHLFLTRAVEEKLERLVKQGKVVGNLYRSLGQEATAVGSAAALEDGDWLCPSIRDLGSLFVRGLEPREMFLQYMARGPSLCAGRDTTTHFIVPELGILGPISPLGTQVSVLAGIGHAFRLRDEDRVCMTYQSDGGSRTGAFHEGMNLAAVRELPLVLVLEHNRWAYSTPSHREAAVESWADVGEAYGVPLRQVDGNDVLEVYDACAQAVARARRGEGASMVVAETYRMLGHAQHDPQPYVSEEELERWRERDPVERFEDYLVEYGFASGEGLEEMREEIRDRVDRAAEEADGAPMPERAQQAAADVGPGVAQPQHQRRCPHRRRLPRRALHLGIAAMRLRPRHFGELVGLDIVQDAHAFRSTLLGRRMEPHKGSLR